MRSIISFAAGVIAGTATMWLWNERYAIPAAFIALAIMLAIFRKHN